MVGTYGPVIFSVSSFRVLTMNNISHNASKRTATHNVMEGKPLLEYLGPGLEGFKFDIKLSAEFGVRPRDMLEKLNDMTQSKTAYPLVIGGRPVGDNDWSLTSISDTWDTLYSGGELTEASVSLTLTEYVNEI